MQISIKTNKGIGKSISDDAIVIDEGVFSDTELSMEKDAVDLVAIADGVGGISGGNIASKYVLEALSRLIGENNDKSHIEQEIKRINNNLIQYAKEETTSPNIATTLSGMIRVDDIFCLFHLGNTRIYKKSGNYLKQLTTDQTTKSFLENIGDIEAADKCNPNEIYACMGGGNPSLADKLVCSEMVLEKTVYLFTSDGIHDHLPLEVLEEVLTEDIDDLSKARLLVDKAVESGSQDDCSVVIIRM